MKQLHISLVVLMAAVLFAAPASAKDLNGRFAVGGGATLLGNTGVSVRYWAGPLDVGLLASYATLSEEQTVGDQTGDNVANEADVSLRVHFNAARAANTNMLIGAGFTLGTYSFKDYQGNEESWNEMGIEFMLGVEHFFGNHFSLLFETGVPIRLADDSNGGAIGRISGMSLLGSAGHYVKIGGLSPTFATSFNFYF